MSVMNKQIFEALIEAGASEEKAADAAESVADYQKDINSINQKLAMIHGDLIVVKWGIGIITAAVVLPLIKNLL